MIKKKILVIDDEEMLVEFVKIRLEANDYIVETAYDGPTGLSKAEQTRPDLIILDVFMKPMDGYAVLKAVRSNEEIRNIPVIMLTASGKKRDLFEAEGISDYITKPFDNKDFLSRVRKTLKAKK